MSATHQPRPTMRDVADRAGVSFKTVSRVVNDEGGVSDDLVDRVEQAIAALGYRPDDRARHLRQTASRTGAIGFILVDVVEPVLLVDPARHRGGRPQARVPRPGRAAPTVSANARTNSSRPSSPAASTGSSSCHPDPAPARSAPRSNAARRWCSSTSNPRASTVDLVRSDHRGGALLATQHLQAHGHRDIAFFGDDATIFSAGLRLQGYREAMSQAGLEVDERRIVHGRHTSEVWRRIIRDYLLEAESADGAVLRPEHHHGRGHAGAARPRAARNDRPHRLRRHRARRCRPTRHLGRSPASAGSRPPGGRATLRAHRGSRRTTDPASHRRRRRRTRFRRDPTAPVTGATPPPRPCATRGRRSRASLSCDRCRRRPTGEVTRRSSR